MPQPFVYATGQRLTITVTVASGHDEGHPIIDIGGHYVSVSREALDKADSRPESERPRTPEEIDLKRIQEAQDAEAVAKAAAEAAAERAAEAEGAEILARAAADKSAP